MSKYQPPGRLSKVSGQDFIIQIQTEFAWVPHPRITTSVVLDGVSIHKIQKEWDKELETDKQKELVSRFINQQHDEVEKIVKSNQEFILSYSKPNRQEKDYHEIINIEGVHTALLLSSDGLMTPFRDEEIEIARVQMFERLFELVEFLDQTSRLGGMEEAYMVLEEDRIMIFRYRDNYLIIYLDEEASAKDTARKIVEFLKAA